MQRLAQLYAYDFSEILALDVDEAGLFDLGRMLDGCWSAPRRHAFLCRVDGQIAGFAIFDERSRLTGDPEVMDVAQFFVLRKHRRRGVGAACAARAFDLFPRRWEVRQEAKNVAATRFWRATIGRYTNGRFDEASLDDARWHGPVQSFDARCR
ncbi:MAG TPA: GNAT family N-acetyltransferase [Minicystis sp.]|nr:GNAT family N-acetyltransferase [Minicystis sp.]